MWSFIISGLIALSMPANRINEKAVRHFNQSQREAVNEKWTVGQDCFRVTYTIGAIKHITDYHLNGRWRNTIRIYDESHLPENIRHIVKAGFVDSDIILVSELRLGTTLAYFIKIRQREWMKTVKVNEDNVAVVEEFREK